MGGDKKYGKVVLPEGGGIQLREAVREDALLLFDWANDQEVRENSFYTGRISLEGHKAWFEEVLAREDVCQYIFIHEGEKRGQIRLNLTGGRARISYSVAAKHRGRGCGGLMLRLLEEKVRQEFPGVHVLTGEVKPGNAASRRVFLRAGFREVGAGEGRCLYEKRIVKASPAALESPHSHHDG